MQEVQTKAAAAVLGEERNGRTVTLLIQSRLFAMEGNWQWDLYSEAVYCSDVMLTMPTHFEGTKGIVHPDDLPALAAIVLSSAAHPFAVSFRIITTYGEVKYLKGAGIRIVPQEDSSGIETDLFQKAKEKQELAKELYHSQICKTNHELAERITRSGTWYLNSSTDETWYSDAVYRLHGLLPQSLNAHLHTFRPFLHPDDRIAAIEAMDAAIEQKVPLQIQYRIVLVSDEERTIQLNISWGYTEKGESILYGLYQDVTEQSRLEAELQKQNLQESFQRQLLTYAEHASNIGYWQLNVLTRKLVLSENYYRIFGLKPQSVPPNSVSFLHYVHPDDRSVYDEMMQKVRKEHTVPEIDFRILRPDGKTRYLRQKGKAIVTGDEVVLIGTIQDVTVQKTLEKKVSELHESIHLKTFANQQAEVVAGIGSWLWDLQSGEIAWSDHLYRLFGLPAQTVTLTQKILLQAVHPEDQKNFSKELSLMLAEKKESEFHFRLISAGRIRHMKAFFRVTVIDTREHFLGILQDVTSQEETQKLLTERIRLIELLGDSIPDQIMVTDTDNNIVLWNRQCEEVYGWKKDKVLGQNFFDVLPHLKEEELLTCFNKALGGEAVHLVSHRLPGFLRGIFNVSLIPLFDENKTVIGVLHSLRDVTKEHLMHVELTNRLQFIGKLVEATVDRIIAVDKDMNYLYWNKKAEEFYGLQKEAVIGKNILEIFPRYQKLPSYAQFREALRGETVHLPAEEDESGQYFETYLIPIKTDDVVNGVLWIAHDLSAEYALKEEQRKASQILESINELYVELDKEGRFTYINRKAEESWQKKKEDLLGRYIWDVFPEAVGSGGYHLITKALTEGVAGSGEYYSHVLHAWTYMSAVPSANGVVVLFHDVSEITEARQRLEEEHLRFKEAQEIGHIGSFEWFPDSDEVRWSSELYRIYGIHPEEPLTLQNVYKLIHPDDAESVIEKIKEARRTPGNYDFLHRVIRRDGAVRFVNRRIQSIGNEAGEITSIRGTVQDVTELIAAQERIKENEALLKDTEAIGRIGSYEVDLSTMAFRFSDGMFRLFGEEPQSVVPTFSFIDEKSHPNDAAAVRKVLEQAVIDKQPYRYTRRIYTKEGEERIVEVHGKVVCDHAGNAIKLLGLVQDVTERKKAEQELRESKLFIEQVMASTPDFIMVFDLVRNKNQFVNRSAYKGNDERYNETLQIDYRQILRRAHPDDQEALHHYIEQFRTARDNEIHTLDYRVVRDGDVIWYRSRGKVFKRDEQGTPTHYISIIQDITERKNAEQQLLLLKDEIAKTATDKYLTLFNSIDEGFYLCEVLFDEDNRAIDILCLEENPAAVRIIGRSSVGKTLREINPAYEEYWYQIWGDVALSGESRRMEQYSEPDNKWFDFYITKVGEEASRQVMVVFQDVSARRHAEESLRESEARLTAVIEALPVGIGFIDPNGRLIFSNAEMQRFVPGTVVPSRDNERYSRWLGYHSDGRHLERQDFPAARALRGERVVPGIEMLYTDDDGNQHWTRVAAVPINDKEGQIIGAVAVLTDIDEFKRSAEALQQVNTRLVDVLESTTDAFYALDAAFTFTYVNGKAAQLWKRSPESLIGKHYWTEFPRAVGSESYHKHYEVLQSGKPVHYQTISPLLGVWIDVGIYPGKDGGLSVFFREITEQKQAEEKLKNFTALLEQQVAERTKELQKNVAILQQAEALAGMGSWEYDIANGSFSWSEGMCHLYGLLPGTKVTPETYLNLVTDEVRPIAKRILKNLKKGHQSFEELLQIKKENSTRLLRTRGSVVHDKKGQPQKIVGIDIDITAIHEAEKKLQETQRWLEQTAQVSPDAITVYDLKKKQPSYLNNCFADWIGVTSADLVNMGIEGRLNLVHPDDRLNLLHFNEKVKSARDGDVLALEYRVRKNDDTLLWVNNRSKVFQRDSAGNVTHIISFLQDITAEKAAECVLKNLNASLEKKNAELESKNDEITSFAFVASHDLKEPLRKLHTFSDWLLTKEPSLSETGREMLGKINSSVMRLDLLINDVLALTKVHVGNEREKPVDLNHLLQQLQEEMQERIQKSGAVIKTEPMPTLLGAENQLLYLFKNIISNSIKFQPTGQVPLITIQANREDGVIKISVADNGIGIAPEYHRKIFEMFRRLHGRSEYEGTGMGLAICKKIMEKHGGKITVESEENKGAVFTCWFPAALSTS